MKSMTVYINGKLNESFDTIHHRSCLIAEMYEHELSMAEAPSLNSVREDCYAHATKCAHMWSAEELADWWHNYR